MKVILLLGLGWAQSFYVEVKEGVWRERLRDTVFSAHMRQSPFWRGLKKLHALTPQPNHPLGGWFVVEFEGEDSLAVLERLRGFSEITWIEGASGRRLCQSALSGWHHPALGTAAAWTRTQGSPTVIIAIIDSGLEWGLPAFHQQLWINPAEDRNGNHLFDPDDLDGMDSDGNGFADDVIGYDFVDQPFRLVAGDGVVPDPLPHDENGHGTAMASVIGARPDLSPVAGLAPGCKLMILRAFSAEGYGEDDDIARAVIYAAENGARVINCSFGDRVPSRMMHAAMQYAAKKGCVIIASSGNGTGREPHFPSGFPEAISAGGYAYDEASGKFYLWPLSGYYRVDWVAPADRIPALMLDGEVRLLSGTSLSAALSAAAAALLLSQYPDLSPEAVRATFAARAIPLSASGWSYLSGSGRLTLLPALDHPQEALAGWRSPPDRSVFTSPPLFIFSTYHSLLARWEVSWASELAGPWQLIRSGETPKLSDTLRDWRPPIGTFYLRLRLFLRNGREVAYIRTLTYEPQGLRLLNIESISGWQSGIKGIITSWRFSAPLSGCLFAPEPFCSDKIDSVGAVWLPPASQGIFHGYSFGDTLRMTLSLPETDWEALPYRSWQPYALTAPPGFYLSQRGPDWNGDGEPDWIISGLEPESGRLGRVYFLERIGPSLRPYDSISSFFLIPRHLFDWDGDGTPELLCVWIDSFYVFAGVPPKALIYRGAGRAARLDVGETVWIRGEHGDYERYDRSGRRLLTLQDTVRWDGSTTIPRLLPVATPQETLWTFGNYPGWIFLYERNGTLRWALPTALYEVGSHLIVKDIDADGWEEIIYLGRGASETWWELGIISVRNGRVQQRERFWGGLSGIARLIEGWNELLIWLPPHAYLGELRVGGWRAKGFDPFVWEAFGCWEIQGEMLWLLGRDSLPRMHREQMGFPLAIRWDRPGGLSPTQARLRWHALPSSPLYRLYRVEEGSFPLLRYSGGDTAFIERGLTPGRRYVFFVEAQGSFSSPFLIHAGERPCLYEALLDSNGVCVVKGRGEWFGEATGAFLTMPDSLHPLIAVASGNQWLLYFPPTVEGESLFIDTLLADRWGRYLAGDCAVLGIQRDFPPRCILPCAWRVVGSQWVEIDFAEALPSEAFIADRYTVTPAGRVLEVLPGAKGLRLRLSIALEAQPVEVRWRWGDPRCPRHVAFSPLRDSPSSWGFYPNPVRSSDRQLAIWGLSPGDEVRVLTPSGALCARIPITEAETPTLWNLRTLSGERLSAGIYLLQAGRHIEKLFVE